MSLPVFSGFVGQPFTVCAAAGALVALGGAWFALNPEAQKHALEVVRTGAAAVASTGEDIRAHRIGWLPRQAEVCRVRVMHLWLADGDGVPESETAVLRLPASGDT